MSEVVVHLPPLATGQAESWQALLELAPRLGSHWLLVGGQMVFLHEVERESTNVRPTNDIDLVVDIRLDPLALGHTHTVLASAGFEQDLPSPEGVAHRYRRGDAVIDVLAPDHMGSRAVLSLGTGRTIEAPGTSQAFGRAGLVTVELESGTTAVVRRPSLIGALLGKATAVTELVFVSSAERAKHLRDADVLACLVGATDRAQSALTAKERSTLRQLASHPDLSELAARSIELTIGDHVG